MPSTQTESEFERFERGFFNSIGDLPPGSLEAAE
jgi:hypothetical protein